SDAEPVCDGTAVVESAVRSGSDGRRRVYLAVAATYLGTASTGLAYAYSSPALPDIRRTLHISEDDAAWFGSLVLAGGIVAGALSGQLLSLLGRRGTMVVAATLFTAGWLFLAFANSTALLFTGRVLTGGGMAIASAASAVFVAEVAPASLRGALNTGCNFMLALGILVGYAIGKWLNYQWLAAACLVPAVLNGAAFLLYVRESPMWLLQKGRRKEAMEAMQFYRGARFENEFKAMESSVTDVAATLTLGDFAQPYVYKSFLCALLTLLMQQASVINILLFFAQDIFQEAGVAMAADDCAIVVGGILAVVFLAAVLLADKVGLKLLFIVSTALSAASLAALGLCFYLKEVNGQSFLDDYGWLPLASIAFYFISYSLGLGPLPFVFLGELIPLKVKGVATSACIVLFYAFGFLITKTYVDLVHLIGTAASYWFYGLLLVVTSIVFVIFVPDTKGKTLDEIEQIFGKKAVPPQLYNISELVTYHL
ncbi:facilitated trehalose transporter Tret1-like, partial [Dermacentor andersoni]|uniref:facilitated trehalose transporter Tret1-like n=1 Tax=Dermacentor andersoni TaxID=34620 RepID=UPI002415B6FE